MTTSLRPLSCFPSDHRRLVRCVLTDIDDTLTIGGRLTASAFEAMESLDRADIAVVPVTGRPAGWCDQIARQWPVAGAVGENGAFYFSYDAAKRAVRRSYWFPEAHRARDRLRLDKLASRFERRCLVPELLRISDIGNQTSQLIRPRTWAD
jgi:haloacid dehalogenase-like hydrolase